MQAKTPKMRFRHFRSTLYSTTTLQVYVWPPFTLAVTVHSPFLRPQMRQIEPFVLILTILGSLQDQETLRKMRSLSLTVFSFRSFSLT